MFRQFILIALISVIPIALQAQKGTVAGKVVESDGDPIPFANVALFSSDSSLVGGTTTSDGGDFALQAREGIYYLEVSFLSFESAILKGIEVSSGKRTDLSTIMLQENAAVLDEVVIEADRSQMEFKLDKRVFNVGKDLSNSGGDAADILQNVPSVDVDIEGNVSMRGSENVRILINGKESGLTGDGNAESLMLLQGNMIEKVEVITNPSSRYEAEGEVGIINIVLKKEKNKGFNGAFEVNAGYPTNYGGSYSINYRRKWINLFASSGLSYRRRPGNGSSFQEYDGPDTTYSFQRDRDHVRGGLSTVNRAGADFFINDKNTLTAAVIYQYENADNIATIEYSDFNVSNELIQSVIRDEQENEIENEVEVSLLHVKRFEKEDHEWTTEIRFTDNHDRENSELEQISQSNSTSYLYQRSTNTEDQRNLQIQSDYVQPIGNAGKIEGGVRASLRLIENFYQVEIDDGSGFETLPDFSDELTYEENIYAAYAMYSNEWKRLSYQAGIRSEYTDILTRLEISGLENPRDYLNFFPSSHISYQFTEFSSLQASYSRRISRPRFRELIPFYGYTDPRYFYGGNPDLDPEFTDSYELGWLKILSGGGSLLGSVYYRHTQGAVQRITVTDSNSLIRTYPVNLGTQDAYGVELNASLNASRWLRINANANAYYANLQGDYDGINYNTDILTFTTNANATVKLPSDIDMQATLRYNAPRNTAQGKSLSVTTLDLGVSRDFLDGNGTVVFNVKDVFNSGIRRSVTETSFLYAESDFQWRVRQFNLTVNYRINQKKRRGGRGGGYDGGDGY